ncbi:MAG: MoaD/ThiS family protein [Chthoniobacteraceae bacterium]
MPINVLAFAQAVDALGFREREIEGAATETPREILRRLAPDLETKNLRVALDQEYADWDQPIGNAREMAVIPPVSGG